MRRHPGLHRDLLDGCARLADGLLGLGLQPGDRVAILSFNCHQFIEALFAVPAVGLVLVPLNTRLAMAEVRAILDDADATVLLCDRDPGELDSCVRTVIRMPDEYEALILSSIPAALGVGVAENDRSCCDVCIAS